MSFCNLLAIILMPAMILIIYFSLYQSWGLLSASSNQCSNWVINCIWTAHTFLSSLQWHRHENALHTPLYKLLVLRSKPNFIHWLSTSWTPLIHTVPSPVELLPPLLFSSKWVIPLLSYHYQWYTWRYHSICTAWYKLENAECPYHKSFLQSLALSFHLSEWHWSNYSTISCTLY